MSEEKPKDGQLVPADEDRAARLIDAMAKLAAPFAASQTEVARINAETNIEMQRETTKQMGMRLGFTREIERRAAWFEYSVIGFVLIFYAVLLGVGLWRENMTLIGIGASGIVSFVGGLGIGRFGRRPGPGPTQ